MKTIEKIPIELVECEGYIPDQLEFGKLYHSKLYETSTHLCVCGCGQHYALPIKNGEWSITVNDHGAVSVTPSIWHRYKCRAHYVITKGVANILNYPIPEKDWYLISGYEDSQPGE